MSHSSPSQASATPVGQRVHQRDWSSVANLAVLLIAILLLALFFRWRNEYFLTLGNVTSLANEFPILAVPVIAMTLLLVVGGIDLSVGSVMALSSAVIGFLLEAGWSVPIAVLGGVLTGASCGLINGSLTIFLGIPSFIATLGMLEFARGGASWLLSSKTLYIGNKIAGVYSSLPVIKLSAAFLIAGFLAIATHILLSRTTYGRTLIAIGTNEQAAKLAGLRTRVPRLTVFVWVGICAALAGWFTTSSMQAADPNAAVGKELTVIAAVVIGGTSLSGGRGSILASLLGLVLMQILESGLQSIGSSEPEKRMTVGCVIVIAVSADAIRSAIATGSWKRWINRRRSNPLHQKTN